MLPLTKKFPAIKFDIIKTFNRARVSKMSLPHGEISTPIYMPVIKIKRPENRISYFQQVSSEIHICMKILIWIS